MMAEIQFVAHADLKLYKQYYDYVTFYEIGKLYPSDEFQQDFGSGEHTYKWLLIEEINATEPKYVCAKRVYTEAQMKELEPYCICNGCSRSMSRWTWLVGGNGRAYEGCLKRGWHGANPEYVRAAEKRLGIH